MKKLIIIGSLIIILIGLIFVQTLPAKKISGESSYGPGGIFICDCTKSDNSDCTCILPDEPKD